jgi:hypothetical protein
MLGGSIGKVLKLISSQAASQARRRQRSRQGQQPQLDGAVPAPLLAPSATDPPARPLPAAAALPSSAGVSKTCGGLAVGGRWWVIGLGRVGGRSQERQGSPWRQGLAKSTAHNL